jgi:hypothetical protein
MLYSTVKLTTSKGGKPSSAGTGFFMRFDTSADRAFLAIVTNKHVVSSGDMVTALCHFEKDGGPSGKFCSCNMGTPAMVIEHPDPDVDLCAIAFSDIMNKAGDQGTPLFVKFLALELVPENDDWQYFDAMEEVTMIGCPNGISDETNNLPIVRRGITATSLGKNYNGKQEFMVDMACFPGSSGSPIFLYDRNGYLDRRANTFRIGASRLKLVGVLYAGPRIANNGQIILTQPPTFEVATMMHLGNAIKSTQLRTLHEEVKKRVAAVLTAAGAAGSQGTSL